MSRWRDAGKPVKETDGLTIEIVLEHYGIRHTSRGKQMISCPVQPDDSRPSCSIDLSKQLWKCHSCGQGGDAWTLLMELEGITDYRRAREFAATHGLADSDDGRSAHAVSSDTRWGRGGGAVSSAPGNHKGNGAYKPSWRS